MNSVMQQASLVRQTAHMRQKPVAQCIALKQKKSFIKALLPQGFPTNYAQLVVSVFFLGSYVGENIINPLAASLGKRPVALLVTAMFLAAAIIISNLSASAMANVVKALQVMAILAGVLSLLYSLHGGANMVPFHELVNSGTAAKNLLLILLVGVVLGTHSAQIKQSLGQIISPASIGYAAKKSAVTAPSKLDKVGLDVVSSDEYLFSSLYE